MGVCLQMYSTYIVVDYVCCSFVAVRFYSIGANIELLAIAAVIDTCFWDFSSHFAKPSGKVSIEIGGKPVSAMSFICLIEESKEPLKAFICICTRRDMTFSFGKHVLRRVLGHNILEENRLTLDSCFIAEKNHLMGARSRWMPRDTPRLRDSLPCVESHLSYTAVKRNRTVMPLDYVAKRMSKRRSPVVGIFCERSLLQNVPPELSQVVLLVVSPLTEEAFIGQGFFVALVLQSGEFDAANEVCNLEHPVFSWMRFPVHHRTLKEGVLECCVKNAGNEGLPVVVVNLDKVKLGELVEVVKQELGQVALHGTNELIRRLESILSIDKGVVAERRMLHKRAEGHEELGAQRRIEAPVLIVCPEKRVEVEGDVWETSARERLLVQIDRVGEIVVLVMKDQGEQIVLGFSSEVAGLIYKDGELLHETSPLDTKSAGGNPPALDSPLLRGDHPSYTTSRSAESIVCEPEHKFVTIEANTCSTYRRAA